MKKCFWHPERKAKWIVNLGSAIDRDTPACNKCKEKVMSVKGARIVKKLENDNGR